MIVIYVCITYLFFISIIRINNNSLFITEERGTGFYRAFIDRTMRLFVFQPIALLMSYYLIRIQTLDEKTNKYSTSP